eukprot:scaffold150602_cov35-Tisochrysis_lutea.AAC.4
MQEENATSSTEEDDKKDSWNRRQDLWSNTQMIEVDVSIGAGHPVAYDGAQRIGNHGGRQFIKRIARRFIHSSIVVDCGEPVQVPIGNDTLRAVVEVVVARQHKDDGGGQRIALWQVAHPDVPDIVPVVCVPGASADAIS